jgi:aspartate kinase
VQVFKFGGTSVGSAQRIKEVAGLVDNGQQKIVVLSAMTGTTNALVEIADSLYKRNFDAANEQLNKLEENYERVVNELLSSSNGKAKGAELIKTHFNYIRTFTRDTINLYDEKEILAQGELISTALMQFYLEEIGIKSHLISALNYMRIDKFGEPDDFYIKENLKREIAALGESYVIITQGFICRNAYGQIDNLQRGGSDYSATLIGAALSVDEVQIWTDIDGVHTNDPRVVENTHAIAELSFDEAAELAYFGAKILHPTCVTPAKMANIPVRIKNTLDPLAPGTLITSNCSKQRVRAIAAKDGITAIKIKSGRMLMAHGFLRKVFEIFEAYKTSIDMITTSEVGVSVTIDDAKFLNEIVADLKKYGTVDVDTDQVIICVVGDLIAENKGIAASVFDAVKEVPLRMISYGGSNHNISMLVKAAYKKEALIALSENLFND